MTSPESLVPTQGIPTQAELTQPLPKQLATEDLHGEGGAVYLGEMTGNAADRIQVAYNGLRARLAERRAYKQEGRVSEREHEEDFYTSLGDTALTVVYEGENLPTPPVTIIPLTKEAASDRRLMAYKEAHARNPGVLPPRPVKPPVEAPLRLGLAPETARERRAAKQFAERAHQVRDERRSQSRDLKMFGGTGLYSARKTLIRKHKMATKDKRDFESGRIDAFEFERRQRALGGVQVTNTPPVLVTRARRLDHASEVLETDYEHRAEQARKDRDKAAEKAEKAAGKGRARRLKQAEAYARIRVKADDRARQKRLSDLGNSIGGQSAHNADNTFFDQDADENQL